MMNFGVTGSRPPSARRPQSINPITGVELCHTPGRLDRPSSGVGKRESVGKVSSQDQEKRPASKAKSTPSSRPDGVPSLNLGRLGGQEDDMCVDLNLDPYHYKITSPDAASAVSWGTPSSFSHRSKAQERFAKKGSQSSHRAKNQPPELVESSRQKPRTKGSTTVKPPTVWDQPPCPENLPPPSDRHRQQYREYREEMKQSYKAKSRPVTEEEVSARVAQLKLDFGKEDRHEDETDDPMDQLQKDWKIRQSSRAQDLRQMDAEGLEMEKKKNKLIETVLIDQLSRSVLSDPEQNVSRSSHHGYHQPGMKRGSVRTLHDSKVATSGTATEKMLSKRIRFGARILSTIGRDAVRELMGFYFHMDNSITIYEYKLFGKTAKALPFIKRGRYHYLGGPRKGNIYEAKDITVGGTLHFETRDQPLPDSIKQRPTIAFRVTDLDTAARNTIVLEEVPRHRHESFIKQLDPPSSEEEKQQRELFRSVHRHVQGQLRKRGVKVMTGLGRMLRKLDESGDGMVNQFELERALLDFHIDIPQEKFDDIWAVLDEDGSGYLDRGQFVRGFLGEMSEARKAVVRKAFTKIDTTRKGTVTLGDMAKFYKANKHPRVISGELDETDVTESFLSSFNESKVKGEVGYEEFEEYYEGVSLGVENDEQFANILHNAWSV